MPASLWTSSTPDFCRNPSRHLLASSPAHMTSLITTSGLIPLPARHLVTAPPPQQPRNVYLDTDLLAWRDTTRPALGSLLEPVTGLPTACPPRLCPPLTSSPSVCLQGRGCSSRPQGPGTCSMKHRRPPVPPRGTAGFRAVAGVGGGAGRQLLPPGAHLPRARLPTFRLSLKEIFTHPCPHQQRPRPAPAALCGSALDRSRLLTGRPFLPPFHLCLRSPLPRHKSEESGSPDTRNAFRGAQELILKISLNFPGHHKPLLRIGLVIFLGGRPMYFTGLMAL